MKLVMCAMRDQLTGFMNPFPVVNEGVAKRDFKIVINDKDQKLYYNPAHFDLYRIGDFDTETGVLVPCDPEIIVTGLSVKEVE